MKMLVAASIALAGAFAGAPAATGEATRPPLIGTFGQEPRFERVFGRRIAYHEFGTRHRGRGPTLILIPQLSFDSNQWAANAREIGSRFHVIAIDPLGIGRSDNPMIDYKMDTWTDTFAEFLRRKQLGRAVFGGSGMGGALSVQMALDYPDLVSGIIVAGSNSGPGEHAGAARPSGPWSTSLAGARNFLIDSFHDRSLITDEVVRARFESRLRATDGYTMQRHLADHRPPYSAAELSRITVPALFPWCREDRVTPLSWGEDFARPIPNARVAVMEGCGHFPNMERPAEFNALVMEFLEPIPAR